MKKNLLTAAVVAGFAGAAGLANAVELNPDGLGQVLIYPYYTVNAGQTTVLSVVNTTSLAKAVKVRFLEGYNSQEVLDFNLFLSAYDVWTANVFALSATGGGNILTDDKSCTNPDLRNRPTKLPDGRSYEPFRNNQYQASGPKGLDRTREGHIELIDMATIAAGSALEAGVTHVSGTPDDCSVARSVQSSDAALLPPSGGLFGSGTIVNPAIGTIYAYNADAVDGFYAVTSGNLFSGSSSVTPSLAQAQTDATTAVAYNYATASSGGSNLVVTSTYALANAIDAVSSVFTASSINNEYVIEAASGSESEWIVTFPTKRFYVNGATAIAPFTKVFTTASYSCAVVGIQYFDREEQTTFLVDDFSPPPTIQPSSLCYEAQAITFQNAADYVAGNGVGKVLGSKLTTNVDPRGNGGFQSGWMSLNLDPGAEPHALRASLDGDVFHGLPVTGFLAVNYINANNGAPGVLANYSGLYRHRSKRNCTNQGGACS